MACKCGICRAIAESPELPGAMAIFFVSLPPDTQDVLAAVGRVSRGAGRPGDAEIIKAAASGCADGGSQWRR